MNLNEHISRLGSWHNELALREIYSLRKKMIIEKNERHEKMRKENANERNSEDEMNESEYVNEK